MLVSKCGGKIDVSFVPLLTATEAHKRSPGVRSGSCNWPEHQLTPSLSPTHRRFAGDASLHIARLRMNPHLQRHFPSQRPSAFLNTAIFPESHDGPSVVLLPTGGVVALA
jgi:hypothetical protein